MPIRAVIFDLDFTLADSSEAVVQCARAGFAAVGLPCPADEEVIRNIGMSFQEFAAHHAGQHAEKVINVFRTQSHKISWLDAIKMLPGARAVLEDLKARGLLLGMATQKSRKSLDAILRHPGLAGIFDATVSGDCIRNRKPAPDCLWRCLDLLHVSASEAIYVGDHPYDIAAARAARVRVVSIAAGPTSRDELAALEPDWLIDTIRELPGVVSRIGVSL